MLDNFNRKINYLRISVTDRCNLRCKYCMPAEGIKQISHNEILRYDEIIDVCKIAVKFGVNKIRITGGEPLVRKGIENLIADIAKIPGVKDLSMTTNGILLEKYAQQLKDAGLMRVNISLDTLDPKEYKEITRGGSFDQVIKGIEIAKKVGLTPVKINAVILDKTNTQRKIDLQEFGKRMGVQVRFISQMDLETGAFSVVEGGSGGDCSVCNRLRLTANGFIKPCLFSDDEYSIREFGIEGAILEAVRLKPEKGISCLNGNFYNIGG